MTSRASLSFHDFSVQLLRRPYQSSIKVNVKTNGQIFVSTSKRTPLKEVLNFLEKSNSWIQKKLRETELLKKKYPLKTYTQNEVFLLLGETYDLKFFSSSSFSLKADSLKKELQCFIPNSDWDESYLTQPKPFIREKVLFLYKDYGKHILSQSLRFYSEHMGVSFSHVSYRSQKTRWGSCNSRGHISLNWRLVVAPLSVMNYVVIHELSHLRYLDHSKRFWNLIEKYCPTYQKERRWLSEHQYEMDFLSTPSELFY